MKLESIDLEPDEIRVINSPDRFKKEIKFEDSRMSMDLPIVIKYDYLDLERTDYHFRQAFKLEDTQKYFEMMKEISSNTINSLSAKANAYHFRRSEIKGNLMKVMAKAMPEAIQSNPIIYHFALYTSKQQADRNKDIRSPRVYFMLGTYGFIYPLFFDPYHEINP